MKKQDSPDSNNTIALAYSRVVDALYDIAALDEKLFKQAVCSKLQILENSCTNINKIIEFDQCGIMLVDEQDFDFKLAYSNAADHRVLTSLIEKCIREGTFSWALNQNRAVVLHGEEAEKSAVLHAISVRDKVIGMFIGVYDEQRADFDEVLLALVTIILGKCAYQCEMSVLHAELVKQNETLEDQVRVRTAELLDATRKAEQAMHTKGAFLAMMSHEIRTPLNGVLGMAQMLARSQLDDEQHKQINVILSSGQSLLTVINDVLDYSKMEAGKLDVVIEPLDIKALLDEVVNLYAGKAEEKNIELSATLAPGRHEYVYGDRTRLQQILFNLVSNAIKFTEQGNVTIKVDMNSQDSDMLNCIFRITDTGIGIDDCAQHELFNEFTQADTFTTRKYGGTGLGLAISRRLVELMGGEINVESRLGAGSTFWFRLSLARASEAEFLQKQRANDPAHAGNTQLDIHVLLVEDNVVNQMVATAMFDDMGVHYSIADNGAIATQMSVAQQYDLILMDCQMPVMDGYTATQQIRQSVHSNNRQTPIIALSAEVGEEFQKRCRQAGMNGVLSKPVVFNDLFNMLQRCTQPTDAQRHG